MWALVLAIASFVVCPLVGAVVALVLAGAAAGVIRSSGGARTGEGMVTAARIIAGVNIAFSVITVILLVVFADELGEGINELLDRKPVHELEAGECFDDASFGDSVTDVIVLDCDIEHEGEAILADRHDEPVGAPWPGSEAVATAAAARCRQAFSAYTGRTLEGSGYDLTWFTVDADRWAAGQRWLVCAVIDAGGGDLRGSARAG